MEFPQYFDVVKGRIDDAVSFVFHNIKNMNPLLFARGHIDVLSLFVDKADIDHVLAKLGANQDPEALVLSRVLNGCNVAKTLFNSSQKRMLYVLFVQEIERRLKDLEGLDYMLDEVRTYTDLMQKEAVALQGVGLKEFQKKKSQLAFLALSVQPILSCPDDEHRFRLAARLKQCALNAGDLTQLPWEAAWFSPSELHGIPQTCRVPKELLASFELGRAGLKDYFGHELLHVGEYKKIFNSNLQALKQLGRTITIELEFLVNHAEKVLTEKVHKLALATLPSEAKAVSYAEALAGLEKVRGSQACVMVGMGLQLEIDGVLKMVRGLAEGVGLDSSTLGGYSPFYKYCVKMLENFVRYDVDLATHSGGALTKKGAAPRLVTLAGKRAIDWKLGELARAGKADGKVDVTEFKVLKVFDWVLDKDQRSHRDRFLDVLLKQQVSLMSCIADLPDKDGSSCTKSAASSSGALALFEKTNVLTFSAPKKVDKKGKGDDDLGASLLTKFFRPKKVC